MLTSLTSAKLLKACLKLSRLLGGAVDFIGTSYMHSRVILISCKTQKPFKEQKSVLPFLGECPSLSSKVELPITLLLETDS